MTCCEIYLTSSQRSQKVYLYAYAWYENKQKPIYFLRLNWSKLVVWTVEQTTNKNWVLYNLNLLVLIEILLLFLNVSENEYIQAARMHHQIRGLLICWNSVETRWQKFRLFLTTDAIKGWKKIMTAIITLLYSYTEKNENQS